MIKGCIWDADGTLLDSMFIWKKAAEQFSAQCGYSLTESVYQDMITMSLEQSSCYLKEIYHVSDTPQEIQMKFLSVIETFYRFEVQAKPGIPSFLKQLAQKKIKMVIATAGDRILLEAALKRLKLLSYFEAIFTCTEWKTDKNDPLIYTVAAEYLGTKPEETAVFEDAFHAVQTAKNAGFFVVAAEDAENRCDQDAIRQTADLYIHDFSQIPCLFQEKMMHENRRKEYIEIKRSQA